MNDLKMTNAGDYMKTNNTRVIVWSKQNCPYCVKAKYLLKLKSYEYEERVIGEGWTREQLLEAVPTARTVPQIFIGEELVGGYDQLVVWFENK
jgi:glutaredoxin